jgi:hypothetical protein
MGNVNANKMGSALENSQAYSPRAGLVSPGVNPQTGAVNTIPAGVSTVATAPAQFTGGTAGLKQLIDIQKDQNAQSGLQSEIELRKAQTSDTQAQTSQRGVNSVAQIINAQTRQKQVKQQQTNQQQIQQRLNADTPEKVAKEIDVQYPVVLADGTKQPSAQQFLSAYQNKTGSYGDIDASGNWVTKADGSLYSANPATAGFNTTLPQEQAGPFMSATALQGYGMRLARIQASPPVAGGPPAQPGGQPAAPQPGGSGPVQVSSPQEAQSLPSGTQFIIPPGYPNAGQIRTRQ